MTCSIWPGGFTAKCDWVGVERGEISRYTRLDRIETVDALSFTSVGEIDKKAIREWPQIRRADFP